jgi:hypothetical protein
LLRGNSWTCKHSGKDFLQGSVGTKFAYFSLKSIQFLKCEKTCKIKESFTTAGSLPATGGRPTLVPVVCHYTSAEAECWWAACLFSLLTVETGKGFFARKGVVGPARAGCLTKARRAGVAVFHFENTDGISKKKKEGLV